MADLDYSVLACSLTRNPTVKLWIRNLPLDGGPDARDLAVAGIWEEMRLLDAKARQRKIHLPLEGHHVMVVAPKGFSQALRDHPDLLSPKLRPLFKKADSVASSEPGRLFAYRFWSPGAVETEALMAATLVARQEEDGSLVFLPLLVERAHPAAAVLQYLDEMTQGDVRPLALLNGVVSGPLEPDGSSPSDAQSSANDATSMSSPDKRRSTLSFLETISRRGSGNGPRHHPHHIAATLMDQALLHQGILTDEDVREQGAGLRWLRAMLEARAVVVLETEWHFLEEIILGAIQRELSLPCRFVGPIGPSDPILSMERTTSPCVVVLPMNAYPRLADPERLAQDILVTEHAAVISCSSLRTLPEPPCVGSWKSASSSRAGTEICSSGCLKPISRKRRVMTCRAVSTNPGSAMSSRWTSRASSRWPMTLRPRWSSYANGSRLA